MEKNKTTVKNTKIGKANIQQLIKEEASVIKRKKEIYEAIKTFNKELGELNKKGLGKIGLNERTMAIGAHGFGATPGIQANPTGFVYPQNISHVAELEAELAPDEAVVLDSPESKEMVDMPADKQIVDPDVKKQLIDMKEKLEMILSSLGVGTAPTVPVGGTEATQAAAQTETPDESESEVEKDDEDGDEKEEEKEDEDGEEEEIVISESKSKKPTVKK